MMANRLYYTSKEAKQMEAGPAQFASERCHPDERRQPFPVYMEVGSSYCSLPEFYGLVRMVDVTKGQKTYRKPLHKLVKLIDKKNESSIQTQLQCNFAE